MLVVPGAEHGVVGTPYGRRRLQDFLVRNLFGVEPRANQALGSRGRQIVSCFAWRLYRLTYSAPKTFGFLLRTLDKPGVLFIY